MVTAEFIVLITFQVLSPAVWQRDVIEDADGYSIESIGMCHSENIWFFSNTLMVLNVIFLFVALVLCWQTKDIPSDFSESNYIFLSVMFMFQILLLTVPISTMVRNDANVFYFIRIGSVFLQNLSVLLLIFVPKMRRIYNGEDTDSSIKNALAGSDTFKEGRSSFIRARASRFYTDSLNSRTGAIEDRSQDSVFRSQDSCFKYSRESNVLSEDSDLQGESQDGDDMSSDDSFDRSVERTVEVISNLEYYKTTTSISEEVLKQIDESNADERTEINDAEHDEEFVDRRNEDDKVVLLDEDRQKLEKQLRRVSWRNET